MEVQKFKRSPILGALGSYNRTSQTECLINNRNLIVTIQGAENRFSWLQTAILFPVSLHGLKD